MDIYQVSSATWAATVDRLRKSFSNQVIQENTQNKTSKRKKNIVVNISPQDLKLKENKLQAQKIQSYALTLSRTDLIKHS